MAALGMLILGAFVGYVVTYALQKVTDWSKPIPILSGVLSAAVGGGLFAAIEAVADTRIGDAIYFYPVGLGYGALCANLKWVTEGRPNWLKTLHVAAFAFASVALVAIMFCPPVLNALPDIPPRPAKKAAPEAAAPEHAK